MLGAFLQKLLHYRNAYLPPLLPFNVDLRPVAEALGGRLVKCRRVSGLANETFRVNVEIDGEVKRFAVKVYLGRSAREKAQKERAIYSLLPNYGLGAPAVVLDDLAGRLLGRPLLAWEWVEGVKAEEALGKAPATASLMGAGLARFHEVPYRDAGLREPEEGFWAREAAGVELLLKLRGLRAPRELFLKLPGEGRTALLHGDYNAGNLLVSQGKLYVFDCESACVGDPLYDAAYAYAFLSVSSFRAAELFARSYFASSQLDPRGFAQAVKLVALKLYCFLSSSFLKSYVRWKAGLSYPLVDLALLRRMRRHLLRLAELGGGSLARGL